MTTEISNQIGLSITYVKTIKEPVLGQIRAIGKLLRKSNLLPFYKSVILIISEKKIRTGRFRSFQRLVNSGNINPDFITSLSW